MAYTEKCTRSLNAGGGEISCEGGLGTGNALPGEQGAARVQESFAAIVSEHQQRKNQIGNKTQTLKRRFKAAPSQAPLPHSKAPVATADGGIAPPKLNAPELALDRRSLVSYNSSVCLSSGTPRKNPTRPLAGKSARAWENVTYWQADSLSRQLSTPGGNSKRILFLNGRSWNVIENKGPLWKTFQRSRNVYENTGT